jgi:hypothetical protein
MYPCPGQKVVPVLEDGLHGGEEAGRALDQTREDKLEPKTRHTRQEAGYDGETTLLIHTRKHDRWFQVHKAEVRGAESGERGQAAVHYI